MPADGAHLRAAGEQLGNEGSSDVARRSGDQDHVNSLMCRVHSKGRKRPPESDSADVMGRQEGSPVPPVTMGGAGDTLTLSAPNNFPLDPCVLPFADGLSWRCADLLAHPLLRHPARDLAW